MGITVFGLMVLGAYLVAVLVDRLVPLKPPRRIRSR
jgi:hypothetical protein